MVHPNVATSEAEIDAALERAQQMPALPQAMAAEYDPRLDVILLRIDNGRRLVIPREDLQGLHEATPEQLSDVQIFHGLDIAWPQLDVDHYLPALIDGIYGSDPWMKGLRKADSRRLKPDAVLSRCAGLNL